MLPGVLGEQCSRTPLPLASLQRNLPVFAACFNFRLPSLDRVSFNIVCLLEILLRAPSPIRWANASSCQRLSGS